MRKLSFEVIEQLANKFRAENGYSQSEPIHAKTILRQLNILAVYRPLSPSACGMSLRSKSGNCFMLINSNNPRGRQHFTIAHELFHLFYDENPTSHICSTEGEKDVAEKNADAFASALLIPRSGLFKLIPVDELSSKKISLSTILKAEQYFEVSRQSLVNRLRALKLITEDERTAILALPICETAKLYGYDIALYQKGNENLIIGDFGDKARRLYESEKISEGHYMELLNLISNGQN